MASKKQKGGKPRSASGSKAFLVILILAAAAAAFFYYKPSLKPSLTSLIGGGVSGDFSSRIDSETEETLSRFKTSFILIDTTKHVDIKTKIVTRKQSLKAYTPEDANQIIEALKKLSEKHKLEFSAPPTGEVKGSSSEIYVTMSKGDIILQAIAIAVDAGIGGEKKLKGKLAIIIDDIGGDIKKTELVAGFDFPVTLAVLPGLQYTRQSVLLAGEKGKEAILHCPMESISDNEDPGPGALKVSMDRDEIIKILGDDIGELQGIKGISNHMGSKFTGDAEKIKIVLEELKKRGLFFIDSRTNSKSRAYDIAKELGVKTAENSIFLDNIKDVPEISKNISKAAEIADKNGSAIAIGHPNPETLMALKMKIPELEAQGTKIVFASELVK